MVPFIRLAEPYFYQIVARKVKAACQDIDCCCGLAEARRKKLRQEERMNDQTFVDRDLPNIMNSSVFSSGDFVERPPDSSHNSGETSGQASPRILSL